MGVLFFIILGFLISVPAGFSQTNPAPLAVPPAPVTLDGKILFYIKTGILSFTAQDMAQIYGELHQNIQDTFNEAGMEIMSAHYLHLRDGNRTAIPDPYLREDYEPRALRVYQNPTPGEESWRTGGKGPEK